MSGKSTRSAPRVERDVGRAVDHPVADATARPRRERLPVEREPETAGRHAIGRAVEGEQRERAPERGVQRHLGRPVEDAQVGATPPRLDLAVAEVRVGEREERAELVVQPRLVRVGSAGHDDEMGGAPLDGRCEGELGVGEVLVRSFPHDGDTFGPRPFPTGGRDRVEVADQEVDGQPEPDRVVEARVGGHDQRVVRELGADTSVGRATPDHDDRRRRPARRCRPGWR